jgi:hypothetical protein
MLLYFPLYIIQKVTLNCLKHKSILKWFKIVSVHTKSISIYKSCSNRHHCYFLKCHHCNLWLINIHPFTNPPKPRSKLISKYVDVIFYGRWKFEVLIVKPIKFTWTKDQLVIFFKKKKLKKIHFQRSFENKVQF